MYAVGTRAQDNLFAAPPALVQTVDGQYVQIPGARPLGFVNTPQPVAARPRTVYRTAQPAQARVVPVQERVVVEQAPRRSWGKTALIVGGSAASGAGLGAVLGGKKGALAGAAIGGGAASIYEATRRR
jgi:hypothetical protein